MKPKSALKSDVRAELWHSFVVLLKSYAAAASMSGLTHGVLELTSHSLNIVAASTILAVSYFPAVGKGTWSVTGSTGQDRGAFELNHDGTIVLDGIEVDMDHAAIELVGYLTSAAKLDAVEVSA